MRTTEVDAAVASGRNTADTTGRNRANLPLVPSADPTFFDSPRAWRAWLADHHDSATELVVGFHKKHTGRPAMTWSESVDQAICFGWIDGVRRSLGDDAYTIRFTPRKPTSIWSRVNIAKVERLRAEGLMAPAGLEAFAQRTDAKSGVYSFERDEEAKLDPAFEERLRANRAASDFFDRQPAGYRRTALHWVVSAKKAETRTRRLETLIDDSAAGLRLKHLRR